jgi:hypothetical protein
MPHASRKHEHAVRRPNTIDLLNKQALRGYLHQMRMMNALGTWFLLDGDEVTP